MGENKKQSHINNEKVVFTVKELSDRWDLPPGTIYDLIKEGKIPTLQISGGRRILKEVIMGMEEDAMFNPRAPKSTRERKLENELIEKEKIITELKSKLIKIHCLTTNDAYQAQLKKLAK